MTHAPVRVAVVDHGTGNLTSLTRALDRVGAQVSRLSAPSSASEFDVAFLPGVGAFPTAMAALRDGGWLTWIDEWVSSGRPLMGVCLGMQLLFDGSEELGGESGLGLIPGTVRALDSRGERLPHIGWSSITWSRQNPLSGGLEEEAAMYHVHSFVCQPTAVEGTLATAVHGEEFTTAATNGANVFGVQFHPEKSSEDGLRLLSNFLGLARRST